MKARAADTDPIRQPTMPKDAVSASLIAHELQVSLRENVSVDWVHRDPARARMRVLVKRILRKYSYPSDLQGAAVQTVLQQAEALSSNWSDARSTFVKVANPI